jgi:hypothetical protein
MLNALRKNDLASDSTLYIYSDEAKTESQQNQVADVRRLIRHVKGFKKVELIEATSNKGLAASVIGGVSEILQKYGKAIILEDDLICSSDFLDYMNNALKTYQDEKSIWSISGYAPPIKIPQNYKGQVYLSPRGCSWGWATWKDRWLNVDWEVTDFEEMDSNYEKKGQFNKGGNDLFKLLELQILGKIDSWAIRWCYSQFREEKQTIYPIKSKVINKGFANNGTHNRGKDSRWDVELSNDSILLPQHIDISPEIIRSFKKHYDLDFIGRVGYFLRKHGGYQALFYLKHLIRK